MKKGYTIVEALTVLTLIILMIFGIHYYQKAKIKNQQKGAQLAVMKIYLTQKLYYKENKKYSDDLLELWKYHKRVPEYPVTIVDVRERAVKKHKHPIKFLRIGDYKIDVKLVGKGFNIKAAPMEHTRSKDLPSFEVDQDKNIVNKNSWFIDISK